MAFLSYHHFIQSIRVVGFMTIKLARTAKWASRTEASLTTVRNRHCFDIITVLKAVTVITGAILTLSNLMYGHGKPDERGKQSHRCQYHGHLPCLLDLLNLGTR